MKRADELLLHIGHGKTGTTTLQNTLMRSSSVLREQGVFFPDIHPGQGNALVLGYHLFDHKDADGHRQKWTKMGFQQLKDTARQAWIDIQQEISEQPPKTLCLSSELFFRPMSPAVIKSAQEHISQVADRSRIVAYLRAPDALFLSHTQEMLKHLLPCNRPSRTFVKDTIAPLMTRWNGSVSLELFDRRVMNEGDVVSDFLAKHLQHVDSSSILKEERAYNTSISSEAMSLLFELSSGQRSWSGDKAVLARQIVKADRRIEHPTKPAPLPGVAETILNWSAPDLFWLRDSRGVVFPDIDYDAIDPEDIDDSVLRICRIENICTVNPDRKSAVLRRASARARLPRTVRRWLAKH